LTIKDHIVCNYVPLISCLVIRPHDLEYGSFGAVVRALLVDNLYFWIKTEMRV